VLIAANCCYARVVGSTPMGTPEQPAMLAPDAIPLPNLPRVLQHKVDVATAEAIVHLHEELYVCWSNCPLADRHWGVDPSGFFTPFVKYGVAIYEARAAILLELRPTLGEYRAWLDFALKTSIVDELAPYRSPEDVERPIFERHLSGWQNHMGRTWRLSGRESSVAPRATQLINALEDCFAGHWSSFLDALHTAIGRRTLPLLTQALKALGAPERANDGQPSGIATVTTPQPQISSTLLLASWSDLEVRFVSEERVRVSVGTTIENLNYAEMGFEDRRSHKPTLAWDVLKALAENLGTLKVSERAWSKTERRIQEIRKILRDRYRLKGDPLPYVDSEGYRAEFRILCNASYDA
jgi:hypothetical protein